MRTREARAARAPRWAALTRWPIDLDDGDEVLVDGRPVEPGQVIVLKQVRDRDGDEGRRRA